MKILLKLESLALWGLSAFLFAHLGYAWWWYALLFFAPDISMLGYLAGPRIGAMIYNVVHHQAVSIGFYVLGFSLGIPLLQLTGVILFGHSNMDRLFGYGLKYADSFQNTHLGMIGRI